MTGNRSSAPPVWRAPDSGKRSASGSLRCACSPGGCWPCCPVRRWRRRRRFRANEFLGASDPHCPLLRRIPSRPPGRTHRPRCPSPASNLRAGTWHRSPFPRLPQPRSPSPRRQANLPPWLPLRLRKRPALRSPQPRFGRPSRRHPPAQRSPPLLRRIQLRQSRQRRLADGALRPMPHPKELPPAKARTGTRLK